MSRFYRLAGVEAPLFDKNNALVTSPLPFLPPLVLGILRLVCGVYLTGSLIYILVEYQHEKGDSGLFFSFFTELSAIGVAAYLWASGVQTVAYGWSARRHQSTSPLSLEKSSAPAVRYPLQRWPRFLQYLHLLLLASVVTYPFLVSGVFWALLATPASLSIPYKLWTNLTTHALNSIIALGEIMLTNSQPPAWIQLPFLVLMLAGYLGVAYLTHATKGIYPYPFLDAAEQGPKLAIYIGGIAAAEIIVFCVAWGLMWCRAKLVEKFNYNTGSSSADPDEEFFPTKRHTGAGLGAV